MIVIGVKRKNGPEVKNNDLDGVIDMECLSGQAQIRNNPIDNFYVGADGRKRACRKPVMKTVRIIDDYGQSDPDLNGNPLDADQFVLAEGPADDYDNNFSPAEGPADDYFLAEGPVDDFEYIGGRRVARRKQKLNMKQSRQQSKINLRNAKAKSKVTKAQAKSQKAIAKVTDAKAKIAQAKALSKVDNNPVNPQDINIGPPAPEKSGLSTGAMVGIGLGALALIGGLVWWKLKK